MERTPQLSAGNNGSKLTCDHCQNTYFNKGNRISRFWLKNRSWNYERQTYKTYKTNTYYTSNNNHNLWTEKPEYLCRCRPNNFNPVFNKLIVSLQMNSIHLHRHIYEAQRYQYQSMLELRFSLPMTVWLHRRYIY